jgi:hypothetical protein
MPQASDEERDRIIEIFGTLDCVTIEWWLKKHGYKLTSAWEWVVPKDHEITPDEHTAIVFLIHEWDYGGYSES